MQLKQHSGQPPNDLQKIAATFFDLLTSEFLQNEQTLLHHIASRAQKLFGRGEAAVFLMTGPLDDQAITYKTGSNLVNGSSTGWRIKRGESIVGWVVETGRAYLIADTQTPLAKEDPGPYFVPLAGAPLDPAARSVACAPLMVQGQVIGALEIAASQPDQFSVDDLELLTLAAYFVAILVQQFRHLQATRRRAQLLDARAKVISQTVPNFDDLDHLLAEMVDSIRINFDFYYVGLYLVERTQAHLTVASGKHADRVQAMLAERRQVAVGSPTMIGWTTHHGKSRIALKVDNDRIIIRHIDPPGLEAPRDKADILEQSKFLSGTQSIIVLPLKAYEMMIGAITIQSEARDYFSEENFSNEDVGTLQALVDQLAFLIYNAKLHRNIAAHARQIEATAQVGADITSILNVEQLLAKTVELIHDKFDLYYAGLFLIEEVEDKGRTWKVAKLKAAAGDGGRKLLTKGHQLAVGSNSMVGHATHTGQARIALDVDMETIRFQHPDLPDARSEMALPLRHRGGLIGALDVQSIHKGAFTWKDIQTLQTMADQLGSAIYNAQLYQLTEEDRQHLAALRDIDQAIMNTELNLEATLRLILEKGLALIGAKKGALLLLTNDKTHLQVVMSNDPAEIGCCLPVEQSIPGLAVKHSQSIRIPEVALEPQPQTLYDFYGPCTAGVLLVPLQENGQVTGVFSISTEFSTFQQYEPLSARHQGTLETLAGHAAIAIKNATLFKQQQETAQKLLEVETLRSMAEATSQSMHWVANQTTPILYWARKIRDIISPIMAQTEIKTDVREDVLAGMEIIEENANLILEAKEGIMGAARPFEQTTLAMTDIIQNALKSVEALATGVRIEQNLRVNLPPVYGDRIALEEVFRNLFINALHAVQVVKTPRLEIRGRLMQARGFIQVNVRDNGPGIPTEKLKEIWTPFYTTKVGVGGTGVGLSYCLQAIHKMGGDIRVESVVGQGTTFIVEIPLRNPEQK